MAWQCRQICKIAAVFCVLLLGCFYSAQAETVIDAGMPEEIQNIARGYGSAKLETDEDGDPLINGKIGGIPYIVLFYGCERNRDCKSISFVARFAVDEFSLEKAQEWNSSARFGTAYLDDEGDPILEMNVNLTNGVSYRNLDDTYDLWRVVLKKFVDDIGLTE